MAALPQLLEEDVRELNAALTDLLTNSEASFALVTDKAGFRLAEQGQIEEIDTTSLASLASGSFLATQEIARLINEPNFNSVYQQGEKYSMLVFDIDEFSVLIVIFRAQQSVGLVKYYAGEAIRKIAAQLKEAKGRAPSEGIDPAMLNLVETADLFKKKSS